MSDEQIRALVRAYSSNPTDENAHALARAVVRATSPAKPIKILISPGFGAGWSTWACSGIAADLALKWPPLIEAVESGEKLSEEHPAVQSLVAEVRKHDEELYLGGLHELIVIEVVPPFRVEEYDGSESVLTSTHLHG